ncbi:hypothetical protein HDU67_009714 [Dinochytrium kinnereticum]|nr:hypothetical protein HDU67_009714 [Dinochytrium kinnereticum]
MTKFQVHPDAARSDPSAAISASNLTLDDGSDIRSFPAPDGGEPTKDWLMAKLRYEEKPHFVPTDDPHRLAEVSFDCFQLAGHYPVEWRSRRKERLFKQIIAPNGYEEYVDRPPLRVVRLRALHLPVMLQVPSLKVKDKMGLERLSRLGRMEFFLVNSFYGFEMDPMTKDGMDWYVNFSDQNLFAYCETDFFASDEILALEHPILGSVREALSSISTEGLFVQTYWEWFTKKPGSQWKDCVRFDDPFLYVPKDKSKPALRYREFSPRVVDQAGRPTPFLFMNVPRLCKITTKGSYQKKTKDEEQPIYQDYDIYGGKFRGTPYPTIKRAVTPLKDQKYYTNLITMTAIDQLSNPLRPKKNEYKIHELRHIFRTAFTAFYGAVTKSCLNGYSFVTVHTGDWGCGEFGGNRTVMAYLQIAAAKAAGVSRMYYHTVGPSDEIKVAQDLLARTWVNETVKMDDVLMAIAELKKEWRTMSSQS